MTTPKIYIAIAGQANSGHANLAYHIEDLLNRLGIYNEIQALSFTEANPGHATPTPRPIKNADLPREVVIQIIQMPEEKKTTPVWANPSLSETIPAMPRAKKKS